MKFTRAFPLTALSLTIAGCAAPTPSVQMEGSAAVCLSSPIEDGRAYLAEHRQALVAEIVRREVFVIADSARDTVRVAHVTDGACEPTDEQLSLEAYRQIRDQFISGFSTHNGECSLRTSPTSDEIRRVLMEDLLSSGLGGVATVQIDSDYLEVTVGASCDLSEPFIREYLERRGVGRKRE